MTKIYNRFPEREKRKLLRNNMTHAEKLLWERLRNRQIGGHKFRRQYSISHYIVDFYCPAKKLAIEVDGEIHNTEQAIQYDKYREEYIKSIGITIIRFSNKLITLDITSVISAIELFIQNLPPCQGGGGRRPEGVLCD